MKKNLVALFVLFFMSGQVFAHSGKPKYHVIIDTDGGIDDMRAISMFLSGNDIRVLVINCSQGTIKADSVYVKVKSLLSEFHHEGVPVGLSKAIDKELPQWSSFAQNINWGHKIDTENLDFTPNAIKQLNKSVEKYTDKITLIALGSLKTYSDWLKANPQIAEKIERIIWYNNHNITEGFNYKISPESFDFIKKSTIRLEIVSTGADKFFINKNYLTQIEQSNSIYALQIKKVQEQINKQKHEEYLFLADDMLPLFLTIPILFETKKETKIKYVQLNKNTPLQFIYEMISKLLLSSTKNENRVFNYFPVDSSLYKPDYAKIVSSTIEKYGLVEWKAITMTNEIHGHTGIYSIIGAKMGIRVLEYFNVGVNNIKITTFAGNKPPLSCFNDGIQISTGATIGQGLISISDSISAIPSVIAECNGYKIHISVKKHVAEKMQEEIKIGVKKHGLLTDKYWLYIEKLALKYWTDFDRHEIFTLKKL